MPDDDFENRQFPSAEGATPMMAQYLALREAAPRDALLFYRMGDFYELFFEDAKAAAAALDIALTRRGEHQGEPIAMCGVPAQTAEAYLARLIRAGFKVAVGEQTEDPKAAKARGSKTVDRAIARIVTPGTLTEDSLLDARTSNRIAALARTPGGDCALAWAEVSTGEFAACPCDANALEAELAALDPAEWLSDEAHFAADARLAPRARLTPLPKAKFDPMAAERRLKTRYGVDSLDAFGAFSRAEIAALGALLDYLELAQAGAPAQLAPPRRVETGSALAIDPATRASLEIDRTQAGHRKGSLLATIDRTVTAPGARRLAARLTRPSTRSDVINARLDAVACLVDSRAARKLVRERLQAAGDPERALSRLLLGRGGPRDLAALGRALSEGEALAAGLGQALPETGAPDLLTEAVDALTLTHKAELARLAADLKAALVDEPPLLARDGGYVAPGWSEALDAARALRDESRKVMAGLQKTYAEASGVSALKIRHNNVLGYFVEVTAKNADPLMESADFIHRQTMANAVRFTTTELAGLEARIAGAAERALGLEGEIFETFRARAEGLAGGLRQTASALAELDCAAALAEWAVETRAVRPVMSDEPVFAVESGRHPVVEAALKATGGVFTPNDCRLDGRGEAGPRLTFVTGPNMAGKSTFLRQNALMVILAQAGSFVPAASAQIGIADRLYSRVGAADDLARGRSTFMTEMIEAAAILNQAGPRSFVILDEVGRGTSTFDGLSIAWAVAEHLHGVNLSRALFATHYHEMTRLADALDHAANVSLKAKEWKGELVFLHTVASGAADRSYGIEVARRAGLPDAAIARARLLLERLESQDRPAAALADLPLFSASPLQAAPARPSEVERRLAGIDPDALSPREALEALYELRRHLAAKET